jgi:signal transduction histidine kinase
VSEPLRLLAILGPIAIATGVTAYIARGLVARAGLAATMVAIAVVASLVTVVDLVVLNHYMLIAPGNRTEMGLVVLYSLSAGVVAALIVGHSTTRALRRVAGVAARLGENDLDARVGELRASPELRQVGAALDLAAARIADLIETDRRTEAARRDLITSISHDLRTPLANLRAMVEAINDGVVDDPDVVRRYAEEMLRSIETLVAMVDDMFDLSQIDAVALRADTREISIAEAVQQAVDGCRLEAQARSISVRTDVGGASAVRCPARLTRVLHSLVDNAVRYTPPGGMVSVTATGDDGSVEVTVDDSGPGLTPAQRTAVFEPFWRGDASRSSRGSGLGLTLAQRITHALGGEIRVSESPGGGASFAVVLPADSSGVHDHRDGGGPPPALVPRLDGLHR